MTGGVLDELISRVGALPAAEQKRLAKEAIEATASMIWVPNPGPQTEAYFSLADELFYGGEAGGGKSDLLMGLSLNAHSRSLVLRRTNKEAEKLFDRYAEIIGNRNGFNEQKGIKYRSRIVDIGGCQLEEDKQKRKGIAHDLKGFDELPDFTESQYTFIIAWNRAADPEQRCRVVATGNPPTKPEGLWVIKRWAAWLDPNHHNPAKSGELRWYTTGANGQEIEVDGPGPHDIGGQQVRALSRTFIRATLSDNPDLEKTNYAANLAALPEGLRLAYRDGRFDVGLKDDIWQCIPSSWIRAAQARWRQHPTPPHGVPMCAIGVDIAQGGEDQTVLASRYDGWYAPLIAVPGKMTPLGSDVAGVVVANRRNNATVVLDMGGGYGSGAYICLKDNGIELVGYKGSEGSTRRTKDGKYQFKNRRSEAYWRFREALDPDQPGGSTIMLPDDPMLVADLAGPKFSTDSNKIVLERKKDLAKRLGRSTDRGDAVIMAWAGGATIANQRDGKWSKGQRPQAQLGHDAQRRRR